ncbi:biotin-dependent carboxyltransferase family protein [Paraclostridium bifermentans]|uniref:5-oxoprolinase subunit C family protein n=1 Tax=Paraclostridium bifermentans TaxID=1490 RepID=UPI001897311E|nr:biotin-dependent carboxyltransferase family protein [Paraclostridium bifermentans]
MGARVLNKGLLSLIQGGPRIGFQQYGVPVSGAMDDYSLRVANVLVGNDEYEACIESLIIGPTIEFDEKSIIAITGGDLGPMLNGIRIDMYRSYIVSSGDVLSFSGMKNGCRTYIAFGGGIDVPIVMGSKSTYIKGKLGGYKGRELRDEDYIKLLKFDGNINSILPKKYVKEHDKEIILRAVRGPQDNMFDSKNIKAFYNSVYNITNECDRMGYRLSGDKINHLDGADIVSDGIAFGAIQIPGHGNPIIMMSDRQTVGGYTKIANVISVDLCKLAQCKPGDKVKFKEVDIYEAHRILKKYEDEISEIKNNIKKFELVNEKFYSINLNGVNYSTICEEIR